MPTYVVLTRLTPEAVKMPGELKRLERVVAEHIRKDCPQVKWVANSGASAMPEPAARFFDLFAAAWWPGRGIGFPRVPASPRPDRLQLHVGSTSSKRSHGMAVQVSV